MIRVAGKVAVCREKCTQVKVIQSFGRLAVRRGKVPLDPNSVTWSNSTSLKSCGEYRLFFSKINECYLHGTIIPEIGSAILPPVAEKYKRLLSCSEC